MKLFLISYHLLWKRNRHALLEKHNNSARPGKKGPCCVDVTKNDMSPEVVGQTYDEQAARPPCVKAILLNTKKGQLCADPDAQWVKDRKLQKENTTQIHPSKERENTSND
uniref:Chemokine interleukin-8-like domain-containing protein n=1 Tax=Oreochromis aureus TaxID=47969 RepID=A0A668TS39_OREAU